MRDFFQNLNHFEREYRAQCEPCENLASPSTGIMELLQGWFYRSKVRKTPYTLSWPEPISCQPFGDFVDGKDRETYEKITNILMNQIPDSKFINLSFAKDRNLYTNELPNNYEFRQHMVRSIGSVCIRERTTCIYKGLTTVFLCLVPFVMQINLLETQCR